MSDPARDQFDRAPRLGRIPDSLIDAVIDGEVDDRARREILSAARRHPQQRRELAETTSLLQALRTPVAGPDLTDRIVSEAHRRRMYIPARVQRIVTRSRMAVAASVLLALMCYVGASRAFPDAGLFNNSPAPITRVAESVASDAQRAMTSVTEVKAAIAPLPTKGSFATVSLGTTDDATPHPGSIAFEETRTGFFTFPPPTEFPRPARHDGEFSPVILYVGSSAISKPKTLEFDRDTNLP